MILFINLNKYLTGCNLNTPRMAYISRVLSRKTLDFLLFSDKKSLKFSQFAFQSSFSVPQSAQVIVCGAGAVGNSVAYHLLKHDWKDIIVLEQSK